MSDQQRTAGGVARWVLTAVLIVLSLVSLTLAPVTIWARNLILDTNGYVSTMAPLAGSPQMQDAVVIAVERQVDQHLDIQIYISQVLPPQAVQRLAPTLKQATLDLVRSVTTKFVRSPQFRDLWVRINRTAHQQVDNLLTGSSTLHGAIQVRSDDIVLDLSQVVSIVKQKLVAAGISIAARVPTFGAAITIAHIQGFSQIQAGVRALNSIANLLPWLGLLFAAGALVAARRRRRAGIALALGVAAGMAVLALGLLAGEQLFTSSLEGRGLSPATGSVLFDTVIRNLRGAIRIILVCALIVAAGVWAGRFVPEIHIPPSAWERAEAPFRTPVARLVAAHAGALRVAVIAVPLAILLLMDGPPLALVVVFACLALVAIALIEVCRRASQAAPTPPVPTS